MEFIKEKKYLLILLSILALAAFFRLYKLADIPPGLYPDVAINGNNALDSLQTGQFKLFYPENNGREGLFMWLIAFSFWLFGPSIWAIKIVAAVFGILTILGTYLLAKELFKKESIALLSSFFLAISFWHNNFSRLGFRAILVPFALVFAFYFLLKGKKCLVASGFFFAFGFYTYISYRFMIFILALFLFFWIKKEGKQALRPILILLLSIFVFSLPIGIYFLGNMQDFFGRAGGVSVFSQQNPLLLALKSLVVHLGMFNIYGDSNWRHNFAGQPELLWPIGIFFVIGLIISIVRIKELKYALLVSWLFFMLLPSILTYEGIPHALRAIGAIPPTMIFSALGAVWIYNRTNKYYRNKPLLYSLIILFLMSLAVAEYSKYFLVFAKKQEAKEAFSYDLKEVGEYLNSLPDNIQKYVVVNLTGVEVNNLPMPAQTPIFIERAKYGKSRTTYLLPEEIDKIKGGVVVPLAKDLNLLAKIIMLFPKGELEEKNNILIYKTN